VYQRDVYVRQDFDSVRDWKQLRGEHDIFNDGRLVIFPTPGHTPGHQSLLVRLDSQAYILTGDAVYDQEKMAARCLPGLLWSPDALVESWELIEEMQRRHDAKLIVTHDIHWEETIQAGARGVVRVTAEAAPGDLLDLVRTACRDDPELPALVFEDGVVVTRAQLWAEVESFAGVPPIAGRAGGPDRRDDGQQGRVHDHLAGGGGLPRGARLAQPGGAQPRRGPHPADSAAGIAVVGREHEALFRELQLSCPALKEIVVADDQEPGGVAAFTGAWSGPRPAEAANDVTNVYYTSGTTGPPKGCMVGHDYWLRFADLVIGLYGITAGDRMLCCLQFFYNDPPWQLLVAMRARTSLVVMRRFSVSRYWRVVRQHDVTVLFGIASTASLLLKAPGQRRRLRSLCPAGHPGRIPAPLHKDLVTRWGAPWVEAYGLTETGLIVSMPVEFATEMIGSGSIGRPCPGADVRVLDSGGAEGQRGRDRRDRGAGSGADARLPEPAGCHRGDLPRGLAPHR